MYFHSTHGIKAELSCLKMLPYFFPYRPRSEVESFSPERTFWRKLAIQSMSLVIERPLDLYAVFAAVICGREPESQHLTLNSSFRGRSLILGVTFSDAGQLQCGFP